MTEKTCICTDEKEWHTYGKTDSYINHLAENSELTLIGHGNCGEIECLSIIANYCPLCGRKLQEDNADSREVLIHGLTSASNFLCETALQFTHPTFADSYPEWNGVYSVGTYLGDVVKQLQEVTDIESD